jgi:hypothetical protein
MKYAKRIILAVVLAIGTFFAGEHLMLQSSMPTTTPHTYTKTQKLAWFYTPEGTHSVVRGTAAILIRRGPSIQLVELQLLTEEEARLLIPPIIRMFHGIR